MCLVFLTDKVRSLYNREQTTARLVGRTAADVETPLVGIFSLFEHVRYAKTNIRQDLTHSYLRAMSPIHLECRSSLSS